MQQKSMSAFVKPDPLEADHSWRSGGENGPAASLTEEVMLAKLPNITVTNRPSTSPKLVFPIRSTCQVNTVIVTIRGSVPTGTPVLKYV